MNKFYSALTVAAEELNRILNSGFSPAGPRLPTVTMPIYSAAAIEKTKRRPKFEREVG
jgi:hypothetical protein